MRWILCLLLIGCSASERISTTATAIRQKADEIIVSVDQIHDNDAQVEQIRSNAESIRESVGVIHATVPHVADITPWWATLLKWLAMAAVGAAAVWLLTASGILGAIRAAIGWIPTRTRSTASMISSTIRNDKPETVRELVAMMRAQDPTLDRALQDLKQKESHDSGKH